MTPAFVTEKFTIGVVGLSHLGIVTSVCLASLGFRIIGVDTDERTIGELQSGACNIPEPTLSALLGKNIKSITFTTDFSKISECAVVLVTKDTPTNERNEMEPAAVNALGDAAIPYLADNVEIALMSQVPVGFTRAFERRISGHRPDLLFSLAYWVDTLVIGDAVARFLKPERIILGFGNASASPGTHVLSLLSCFTCPVLTMRFESAELTKAAINIYLATSVTFANIIANICEATGADIGEVAHGLRLDKRIGQYAYIKPGLGLSGGHLERDVVMLARIAQEQHIKTKFFDVIREESTLRHKWLYDKLEMEVFARVAFPTIAIWGLSYKKNTDSTFCAPSINLIKNFEKRATFVAYDSIAQLPEGVKVHRVNEKYRAVEGADCLLILNNCDEFADIDFERLQKSMAHPLIIDCLGALFEVKQLPAGIRYMAMGRQTMT